MDGLRVIPLPMLSTPSASQTSLLAQAPALVAWWDAVPSLLVALDKHGLIAFANESFCRFLGVEQREELYGRKFGDVADCLHEDSACGQSAACEHCGMTSVLHAARQGKPSVMELRLLQASTGHAIDARIVATPVQVGGEAFVILALTDISDEKRRLALERIFFHDLLNTAGAVAGYAELLHDADPEEAKELACAIGRLSGTVAEEIRAQQELSAAERNDLAVHPENISSRKLLATVAETYRNHSTAQDRAITIDDLACDVPLVSDRILLSRVLGNMVKNALEASPAGATITLRCQATEAHVGFCVHNTGCIPPAVQAQIFQRSFSTKGAGRGLGTYSIRLLSERYLKGSVSFTSTPEAGTEFRVRLPRVPAATTVGPEGVVGGRTSS